MKMFYTFAHNTFLQKIGMVKVDAEDGDDKGGGRRWGGQRRGQNMVWAKAGASMAFVIYCQLWIGINF